MTTAERMPFQQALLDAVLEEFADIPAEEDIDLIPSPAFEEKCKELITKARQGKLRTLSKTMRRIILVAAIIAALATTAMAVPSVRQAILRFFAHDAGSYYNFSFDPELAVNAPEYIEKAYKPTYIPEGYCEDVALIDIGWVVYTWYSPEKDDYISFDQYPIPPDSSGPHPDAGDVTVETLNLNGYQVFAVYSESTMYHWTDNEYFYQLIFGPTVSQEEGKKIFYSIRLDETAVIPEP